VGFGCAIGSGSRVSCPIYHVMQLGFVGLAMLEALGGREGDLVEERRRFRVTLVIATAIYAAGTIGLETVQGGPPVGLQSTLNAAGLLAFVFVFIVAQLSLSRRAPLAPAATMRLGAPAKPMLAPRPEQHVPGHHRCRRASPARERPTLHQQAVDPNPGHHRAGWQAP